MTLEEKLKQALDYLGDKYILAKNSTFKHVRGPFVLEQLKETNNECSY